MVRIAFFGTPEFALPTLCRLVESSHSVVAVVTQPDRPRDRGQKTRTSPIKAFALEHQLKVFNPPQLQDPKFRQILSDTKPDLGVIAAYGQILPDELLKLPHYGFINVHASLLPDYRGAAPIQRAILDGRLETGITIMRVVSKLDAGPILATNSRPIALTENALEVEQALAVMGAKLLIETVDQVLTDQLREQPQDHNAASYAHRLKKADGLIDWDEPAMSIHNKIRALHSWPHAFTYWDRNRYLILESAPPLHPFEKQAKQSPGQIVAVNSKALVVGSGDSVGLSILKIQPEGRRPMSIRDFVSGYHITPDAKFQSLAQV
jgi:methionyl-tRNA formyltransferase